ncbi:cytoplasmic protein [Salmonella enterica]|nr:cytoplasmic protein [Salmonella enterica]
MTAKRETKGISVRATAVNMNPLKSKAGALCVSLPVLQKEIHLNRSLFKF